MITAWLWIKAHLGWTYFTLFVITGVVEAVANDSMASAYADFALAVASLVYFEVWRKRKPKGGTVPPPKTFEEGEVKAILSKGVEPLPTPGEGHPVECTYCRDLGGPSS